jgi:hypothetical protein
MGAELEKRLAGLTGQVEELQRLYHHLDTESTANRRDVATVHETLATVGTAARGLEERMNRHLSTILHLSFIFLFLYKFNM